MNAKTASIAAGVAGTLLFGTFLAHNQSFDLQRKKDPEMTQKVTYTESGKDDKKEKTLKKSNAAVVAMQLTTDTQPQQPSTAPPAQTGKKTTKTRAS